MADKTNNPFRAELGGEQVASSSETALEVDNLSHWFDDFRVLNQVNLTIAATISGVPKPSVVLVLAKTIFWGPQFCGSPTLCW